MEKENALGQVRIADEVIEIIEQSKEDDYITLPEGDDLNTPVITPTPEPTPTPEIVKGTKVRVIGDGYGTSYGESPMCKYRYEGYIGLDPMLDRPYPYCVYDDDGAVAWYKREDLEII